jgi:Putative sensor
MSAIAAGRPGADGAAAHGADAGGGTRLRLYRNPPRLLVSAGLWRSAWYLAGYVFAVGWVLFAAAFTATVTAAVFAITLAGIPLLIAAAEVLRWCANVERARLRQVLTAPVSGGYRKVAATGLIARAKGRWRDSATWRDTAYLIGLWGPLFTLDTAVLAVWLTLLAGVTLPAWYWAPRGNAGLGYTSPTATHGVPLGYFPHGPNGRGSVGLYVDTLPKALLAAAIFAAAFLLFSYVVVLTARAHAAIARSVLRAPTDPLAEAKEVLAGPGPLGPLQNKIQNGSPVGHPT